MAKFNRETKSFDIERQLIQHPDATLNFEGGLAFEQSPELRLYRMACTSLIGEDKFYQTGLEHDEELFVTIDQADFPFTDPGWETDVKIKEDWREILGMGMFHKRILQEAGFDPEKVSGFGFGMGIERLAMLKYGIDDIRTFWRE